MQASLARASRFLEGPIDLQSRLMLLAAAALTLLAGRWASVAYAEWRWYEAIGALEVYRSALAHDAAWRVGTGVAAFAFAFASVGGPRHVAPLARYDLARLKREMSRNEVARGPRSIWRYWMLLPLDDPARAVTLGPLSFPSRRGSRERTSPAMSRAAA